MLGKKADSTFRGKIVLYSATSAGLLIFIAALAVLDAERDVADSSITTFTDALWWSFVTVTTVGYGDMYPVSVVGRLVALSLMIGGVALIGVVTASLASWIVSSVNEQEEEDQGVTSAEVAELREQIAELKAMLGQGRPLGRES